MRKFKMKNADGTEFDLTCQRAFLIYPEGLGTERTHNYFPMGLSYRKLSTAFNQRLPGGTISFSNYAAFQEFAKIVRKEPLALCYMPENEWLYLECDLSYLMKGEISQDTGRLECPVQFSARGTWCGKTETFKVGSVAGNIGKKYPYTYPVTYSDSDIGTIEYENDSGLEQYTKVIIDGPITNPGWVLYKDGATVLSGKVNVVLNKSERLIVDSDPLTYRIAIYDKNNNYLRDAKGYSDFSTERYVVLPVGKCLLNFTNEAADLITAYMEVKKRYELV